jgi:hypothetical protein
MMTPKTASPPAFEDNPSATPAGIEYSCQSTALDRYRTATGSFGRADSLAYLLGRFTCLFDLDPGLLDHLAPALFFAAHIAIEFF